MAVHGTVNNHFRLTSTAARRSLMHGTIRADQIVGRETLFADLLVTDIANIVISRSIAGNGIVPTGSTCFHGGD